MADLKKLLEISDINKENAFSKFKEIAKEMMWNYIIKKGVDKKYAIVEIEFYLYSKEHPDYITYPRKIKSGRWFFHQSGVDLSFNSEINIIQQKDKVKYKAEENSVFGGILIRGIYDINNQKYIFGPQNCVNELWDNFDAFTSSIEQYPVIEKAEFQITRNLYECPRHINIDGNDKHLTRITDWIKRLGIENLEHKNIEDYQRNVFEYPYRFFNLQNEEKPWELMAIPAKARPKEAESNKVG